MSIKYRFYFRIYKFPLELLLYLKRRHSSYTQKYFFRTFSLLKKSSISREKSFFFIKTKYFKSLWFPCWENKRLKTHILKPVMQLTDCVRSINILKSSDQLFRELLGSIFLETSYFRSFSPFIVIYKIYFIKSSLFLEKICLESF